MNQNYQTVVSRTSEQKTILTIIVTVAIAVVCFCLIVKLVFCLVPNTVDLAEIQDVVAVSLNDFKPEPAERLSYLLSLLAIPFILLVTVSWIGKYLERINETIVPLLYYVAVAVSVIGIFILARIGFEPLGQIETYNFLLKENFSPNIVIWSALIGAIITIYLLSAPDLKSSKRLRLAETYLVTLLLGLCFETIFILSLVGEHKFYSSESFDHHFNAVYFAMSQVVAGKTLGIDFTHQYGLYPQLLEPIFKIIPLNVFNLSALFATFMLISWGAIFCLLKEITRNRAIATIGFLAIIYHNYFFCMNEIGLFPPFFQYFPIRFIFPSTAMYMIYRYLKNPSKRLYYIYFIYFSIGVLWNLDSGIVVLLTWLSTLIYSELIKHSNIVIALKRIAAHVVVAGLLFSAVILAYGGYILLRFGAWPQFSVDYQKVFYIYGFMMLPMPKFQLWNLVILTYVFGLTYAARKIWIKEDSETACIVFMISILGAGLFSYYQGRSHEFVFTLVWYPALILLTFYCDSLFSSLREYISQYEKICIGTGIVFFLCSATVCLFFQLNSFFPLLLRESRILHSNGVGSAANVAKFITKHLVKGEEALILSDNSGYYYQTTGASWPFKSPGTTEILLRKDLDTILEGLRTKRVGKIFFDNNFHYFLLSEIFAELSTSYNIRDIGVITSTTNQSEVVTRIGYYEPKQL